MSKNELSEMADYREILKIIANKDREIENLLFTLRSQKEEIIALKHQAISKPKKILPNPVSSVTVMRADESKKSNRARKWKKLRSDPKRFMQDSKWFILRQLSKLL